MKCPDCGEDVEPIDGFTDERTLNHHRNDGDVTACTANVLEQALAAERAAQVAIAAAFGCQPEGSEDLVEAAKLLVAERDTALARVRELEQTVLDVHDALHAKCSGKADLPAEIRALRAKVAALEKERDLALHERDGWRSNRDEIHAEMERQTRLKNEERQEKLQRIAVLSAQKAGLVDFVVQAQGHAESNATSCDDCAWIAGQLARVLAAAAKEQEP